MTRKRYNLGEDTPTKRRLVKRIKAKDPNISESELTSILNGIKRFVMLSQKILNEPQATFAYKEKGKNNKRKVRYIKTDITEIGKIMKGKSRKSHSIQEVYKEVKKTFPEK